jgi:hypothetical protein
MESDNMRKNNIKERGSALILVLLGIIILSLLGVTSLNQSTTDMVISRNFTADKTAFFTADSGINRGTNDLRLTIDPVSVILNQPSGDYRYRSGALANHYGYPITSPQPVQGFLAGFDPSAPPGGSPEMNKGYEYYDWDLTISSFVSGFTKGTNQKEIQAAIVSPSPGY